MLTCLGRGSHSLEKRFGFIIIFWLQILSVSLCRSLFRLGWYKLVLSFGLFRLCQLLNKLLFFFPNRCLLFRCLNRRLRHFTFLLFIGGYFLLLHFATSIFHLLIQLESLLLKLCFILNKLSVISNSELNFVFVTFKRSNLFITERIRQLVIFWWKFINMENDFS